MNVPSPPTDGVTTAGGRLGRGLRNVVSAVLWLVFSNVVQFVWWLTRWRGAEKLWKKLALGFLKKYYQATGGDRLGLVQYPEGSLDLHPVKYVPAEKCDVDEDPGWRAKGVDKAWLPSKAADAELRLGKVPVVPLPSDSHRAASFAEATVAEAIDQGDTRPLYDVEGGELSAEIVYPTAGDDGGDPGGTAQADGGAHMTRRFQPRGSRIFSDMIVDLGSDAYEGTAVSFAKVQELYKESTTSEEMKKQETRGFLAGRSAREWGAMAVKLMLVCLGIIAVVVLGPPLLGHLFGGGGGGGGGGIIPIVTGLLG